jgi:GNAT superfamily N-acetyltransferase
MSAPDNVRIRVARTVREARAAHRLFQRRIGRRLVEDWPSFRVTALTADAAWVPRLVLAEHGSRLVGAQLGGLLPDAGLLSLLYTAVAEGWEGQGVYRALKSAMLAELRALAATRGLPPPAGNVAEEVPGSAQYRRKVERGGALAFPYLYLQPAVQGLAEIPLALTYEPLDGPPPPCTPEVYLRLVAVVYRALYRIVAPEEHPTFRRIAAVALALSHAGRE